MQHPDRRSQRAQRDDLLKTEIQRMYDENRSVYGARKVWRQFVGWRVSSSMGVFLGMAEKGQTVVVDRNVMAVQYRCPLHLSCNNSQVSQ